MDPLPHYGTVRCPRIIAASSTILAAAVAVSCAFGDLFTAAGQGAVQFVWTGDTIVTIDVASPFEVTLMIDGLPATSPAVRLAIVDTMVIKFGATHDSIIGQSVGQTDVVAWIESSLAPRVDTVFRIKARP